MPKAVWNFSYKLKKGISQEDFIKATKNLHDEVIFKAKGFISWEQYLQKDIWTDFVVFETLEDANNATAIGEGNELTKIFYSMIQMNTCKALISSFVIKY